MWQLDNLPLLLLAIPLVTGLVCMAGRNRRFVNMANIAGATGSLLVGLSIVWRVFSQGTLRSFHNLLYLDALSAFLLLVVVLITFLAALYSVPYMDRELEHGIITFKKLNQYYLFYHLFVFTMMMSLMVDNLGVLWVCIEATTLASALLVGFYNKETSLEAAWKYVIICTVGITFALFGIILAYYSSVHILGEASNALNWTTLVKVAGQLDPALMRLAFIFVLIGFGTKAGLAPMHTWLPDAHSQAPSPVSAVLSGVLLNCALYGIIRFQVVAAKAIGIEFSSSMLLLFGFLSIGLAIPFIAVQGEFKRLLAYSSVEHIGVITVGLGLGGRLGYYGAMLHLLNHAIAKSMMFFTAGNLVQKYHSGKIARITGALKHMPITGFALLAGTFAISGAPPFSIFVSEFNIAAAGIKQGHFWLTMMFLLFLALIFAGITYQVSKMALGNYRGREAHGELDSWSGVLLLAPLLLVFIMGFYLPAFMDNMLGQVVGILQGRV